MTDQAATPTGAEASARADTSEAKPISITSRLKAAMGGDTERVEKPEAAAAPVTNEPIPDTQQKAEKPKAEPAEPAEEPAAIETDDDAQETRLSTLSELAEQTGLEIDRLMDLDVPTKIDGKEGNAKLRDLIKGYQLEGHLNQKLMTFAEEKKAHEAELTNHRAQQQQTFMQLNAAVQVAQRLMDGEMAGIDWAGLQQSDPLEFNQKYVAYQQRQAQIQQIAQQIGHERQQAEQQAAQQKQAYRAEQQKLLDTKLPEWADKAKRTKDITDMATTLKDAYGISEAELKNENDHRLILVARDAWRWQQLQKAKPSILNKVREAPKLVKPGAAQSKAAQDAVLAKGNAARLKQSGKVKDAVPLFKNILFGK